MVKKRQPETSLSAYKSLQPDQIAEIYRKILEALGKLGFATYEEIAAYLKMPPAKIWKRMSELHTKELVYRPGTKKMLKSGRMGFQWGLTSGQLIKTEKSQKSLKGQQSISDYSRKLITPSVQIQKKLF
jgi:predicted transcriptional regulator